MFLVVCLGTVSATDDLNISDSQNNILSENDDNLKLSTETPTEELSHSEGEIINNGNTVGTFSDLNTTISTGKDIITLDKDYKFQENDTSLKDGINI